MDVSHRLSQRVGLFLKEKNMKLVTAESCTGGWVAQVITSIPGSSGWFDRGYVAYSNSAKQEMLKVGAKVLKEYGAVSEPVVREMAEGALKLAKADVSVAVTGIAGPDGGGPNRPVGSVWLAWSIKGGNTLTRYTHFVGDREMVRQQAVMAALQGIIDAVEKGLDAKVEQSEVG